MQQNSKMKGEHPAMLRLEDRELTDVVNYLLGLPLRRNPDGGGIVRRDPISICVLRSLRWKRKLRIERWAEAIMREENLLPVLQARCGPIPSCPPEIARFLSHHKWFYERVPKRPGRISCDQTRVA
jgi:hypothetical protein